MNPFESTPILTDQQKTDFVAAMNIAARSCRHDHTQARRILDQIGCDVATVDRFLTFCKANGGFCDCEIMYNVVFRED